MFTQKDFWYMYFKVDIEGNKTKYFLNHQKAKNYYWKNCEGKNASYGGHHIVRGFLRFHHTITPWIHHLNNSS